MTTAPRILPVTTTAVANFSDSISASGAVGTTTSAQWWDSAHTKLFSQWANTFEELTSGYQNTYFDYFYSGQDIQVSIDNLSDPGDTLPIYAFGYNITQQKQPLFGYASYTYDAMLRGTRIVSGAFSLVSTQPYLLTGLIGKSADLRSKTTEVQRYSLKQLDIDESNLNLYWRHNYDTNLDANQQHLFSIHPPFNLVIQYGIQETSAVNIDPSKRASDITAKFNGTNPMYVDTNERLVPNPSVASEMKIILENIELISKSVDYNSEGDPVIENYTFLARDERLLKKVDYSSPTSSTSNSSQNNPYVPSLGINLPPEGFTVDQDGNIVPDTTGSTSNLRRPLVTNPRPAVRVY